MSVHIFIKNILVPDAPAKIKALASAPDSIIVSWLPPVHANGVIAKYTLYMRYWIDGKDVRTFVVLAI